MKNRILFIQLPLWDIGDEYIPANLPLAGGYLKSYLSTINSLYKSFEIDFLPEYLQNFGSDRAISDYIIKNSYNYVAFSCYLWNIERSLSISKMLKLQAKDNIITIAGGPEVYPDSPFSKDKNWFSFSIVGEGEEVFASLLMDFYYAKNRVEGFYSSNKLLKLTDIPSPYPSNIMPKSSYNTVYIETMRGCPNRCTYCYYSKNYPVVRRFPLFWIRETLNWVIREKIEEVYLLDSSFDLKAGLNDRISLLEEINKDKRFKIHTEMRLDRISIEQLKRLIDSGLSSLEVGIQSIHKKVLDNIGRSPIKEDFVDKVNLLLDHNIDLQLGIILGLPGDTVEGYLETLEFLAGKGWARWIEVYILSLLPQTSLRDVALREGWEFQNKPPYFLLKNSSFDVHTIEELIIGTEEILGIDYFTYPWPRLDMHEEGDLLGLIDIHLENESCDIERIVSFSDCMSHSLTLRIYLNKLESNIIKKISCVAELIKKVNPLGIYHIILSPLEGMELFTEDLWKIYAMFLRDDHFVDRNRFYQRNKLRRASTLYLWKDDTIWFKGDDIIKNIPFPVIQVWNNKCWSELILKGEIDDNMALFIPQSISIENLMPDLKILYKDDPELLLFETESQMEKWASIASIELLRHPVTLYRKSI